MSLANNFIIKNYDLLDLNLDQTHIIKRKHLKHLRQFHYREIKDLQETTDWYPSVNSYYHFTEDVDAYARVNHLLENPPKDPFVPVGETEDLYSEKQIQLQYLQSKPISFLILGKPNIGQEDLGRVLAGYWHCTYIDPQTLIEDEIYSGSRAGECIEFNLKCGRAIGNDVILRLLAEKVKSPASQHRGFLICGFPLIPNDLYEEDPISSESAVFNVREIFEEILDTMFEVNLNFSKQHVSIKSEEESIQSLLPVIKELIEEDGGMEILGEYEEIRVKSETISKSTVQEETEEETEEDNNMFEKQTEFLFGLFQDSFIIIYIVCESTDVINQRSSYQYDVNSEQILEMQRIKFVDSSYLVKLPENFPAHVSSQLDQYYRVASKLIERNILLHNVEYFIKVDGRTSVGQMFKIVETRLKILPLQKVLLPQRFFDDKQEGEHPQTFDLSNDEYFAKLKRAQLAHRKYKWTLSNWGDKCPVSLFEATTKLGQAKYCVHFFNKIFFLYDEEAWQKFYDNPRKYIMPPFPREACRIYIYGPERSGKTNVAKCLSYLVNAEILNPDVMYKQYLITKEMEYKEKIRQTALIGGIQLLNEQRQNDWIALTELHSKKINEWKELCLENLQKLLEAFILNDERKREQELSPFPLKLAETSCFNALSATDLRILKEICVNLEINNLPPITSKEICNELINNEDKLLSYLPDELKNKPVIQPATVFDEFVLNYAEEELQKISLVDVEVNEEMVYDIYLSSFKNVKEDWVIDNMSTDIKLLEQFPEEYIADDIIVLKDFSPDFNFLIEKMQREHDIFDFKSFFLSNGKLDAALRCPLDITKSDLNILVTDIILEILAVIELKDHTEKHKKRVNDFIETWENLKGFFLKHNKNIWEVDITGKSTEYLLYEIMNKYEDKFRKKAEIYTEIDRAEDVQEFLEILKEEYGEDVQNQEELFYESRRYGDTYHYCPVSFHYNWVLWKGKEDYTVKFNDQIYLLANESNMNEFVQFPYKFLLEHKPPDTFPPPRICVVGIHGTGKTTIAKALANNLGVRYVSFMNFLKDNTEVYEENIRNYLESGQPLDEELLNQFINKLWFEEPIKLLGFVVDDFPKRPTDLEFMIKTRAIPDCLICIVVQQENLFQRLLEMSLKEWHIMMAEQRRQKEEENAEILRHWENERFNRLNYLLAMKREERYLEKIHALRNFEEEYGEMDQQYLKAAYLEGAGDFEQSIPETEDVVPESGSEEFKEVTEDESLGEFDLSEAKNFKEVDVISIDSIAEQKDRDEAMKLIDQELPEPVFEEVFWETEEEATVRFVTVIETTYFTEVEYTTKLKELTLADLIQWTELDGNLKTHKTIFQSFILTDQIRFRNESLFERCFDVSIEVAEKLLEFGYYFLSKFGKTCPVQYYYDQNPLQMYLPNEEWQELHPVIHRHYIYFLTGEENVKKFKENPLKYVKKKFQFPLIPYRIAIIGPPKCGKSCLAQRYERCFGMKSISRGKAARYVLKHLPYSTLAEKMEELLRIGWELSDETTMKCIEACCFDPKAVTQGVCFDGFPNSYQEVKLLSKLGLIPHLIIDLKTDDIYYLTPLLTVDDLVVKSQALIMHRYNLWSESSEEFRKYLDREYQNMLQLQVKQCLWGLWHEATKVSDSVFYEIKHYYKHVKEGWALNVANMLVTPLEFLERQSQFKTYCPACLMKKLLRYGGEPPDRTGLVQYKKYVYYICPNHFPDFLNYPDKYLFPHNTFKLPQDLPKRLKPNEIDDLNKEECCVVCYWKGMPKRVTVKGDVNYAIAYKFKSYLFDLIDCLNEFMSNPILYGDITINFKQAKPYPSLNYNELPPLGLLEQYVANAVIKAINDTLKLRPLIPGLSISTSASVYMGLFLKLNNPKTKYLSFYKKALDEFHIKRVKLIDYLEEMKKKLNPYIGYIEPLRSVDSSMIDLLENVLEQIDYENHPKLIILHIVDHILNQIDYGG